MCWLLILVLLYFTFISGTGVSITVFPLCVLLFVLQVLVTLHQAVIPYLSNPIMLWYIVLDFVAFVEEILFSC